MPPTDPPPLRPDAVVDFLKKTLPFSELPEEELIILSKNVTVDFYPKGTVVLVRGETMVHDLMLIQKGGVKLFLRDDENRESLIDYRGEGGSIGAPALVGGGPANLDVETVEDTFVFKIPKADFLDSMGRNPFVAQYYLKSFSKGYMNKAFAELRTRRIEVPTEGSMYLFASRVGELVQRSAIAVPLGRTIRESAAQMVREGVGSLLIEDPSGDTIGIVTDKDLRKAVSVGMDYDAPIETIMSYPVATVDSGEICFDALLKMMTRQIHHLAVLQEGEVSGLVTAHDIMVLQGKSPMSLFREIMSQRTIEGLYPLAAKGPMVIRTLIEEGAKADNITRMITVLNDLILEKMLTLLLKEMGKPPAPFCWMLMGSEGRREQTFKTDQDNALIYRDVQDELLQRVCDIYFEAFTNKAIDHLVKCGFPLCPGEIMARNPKWRKPFGVWRDYFERWIAVPEPEQVMNAAIFFDFRAGFGEFSYAEELRNHTARHAKRQETFLRFLAQNCLETKPPLSFFRNFIVEKNGEHKNTLDIKKRGLVPFVDFARVMALKHGIRETNTMGRLKRLMERGHIPDELYKDMSEAYEFLMQLRLVHQVSRYEQELEPNNNIDPGKLSELEKRTLKEAFAVIGRLQSFLKDIFRLNIA